MSSLEDIFESYILDKNSYLHPFRYKKQFPWAKMFDCHPKDKARSVDFFFPDISLAVELDGEQHYRPVAFGGDLEVAYQAFNEQRKRDQRLIDLCHENKITLITIPYFMKSWFASIETINSFIDRAFTND